MVSRGEASQWDVSAPRTDRLWRCRWTLVRGSVGRLGPAICSLGPLPLRPPHRLLSRPPAAPSATITQAGGGSKGAQRGPRPLQTRPCTHNESGGGLKDTNPRVFLFRSADAGKKNNNNNNVLSAAIPSSVLVCLFFLFVFQIKTPNLSSSINP